MVNVQGRMAFGQLGVGHSGGTTQAQAKRSIWTSMSRSFHLFFDNLKQYWTRTKNTPLKDQAEQWAKRINRSLGVLWDGVVFTGSIIAAWTIGLPCTLFPKLSNNFIFHNIERAYVYSPLRYNDILFINDKSLYQKVDGVSVMNGNTKLDAWYFEPEKNKPVILLAHGRASNIQSSEPMIKALIKKGYGVFALDYRGFGDSKGVPSEQGVCADLEAASKYLEDKRKIPAATSQILVGHSLGGAIAADVATRRKFKGVVLASTFTSMQEEMTFVKHKRNGGNGFYKAILPDWLLKLTVKAKFDTLSKIGKVNEPILFVHGAQDQDVNPKFAKQLFDRSHSGHKRHRILSGLKHDLLSDPNDAPKLAEAIDGFIQGLPST